MRSKIRITLTALAAAFALAAPAAQAVDNVVLPINELCENKWNEFAGWVRLASDADRAGNTADRDYYLEQARSAKSSAKALGCDWAAPRAASLDPLGGAPIADGLSVQQSDDSPTTGPVPVESPETVNTAVDTGKSKKNTKGKCKKKSRSKCKKKRSRRA